MAPRKHNMAGTNAVLVFVSCLAVLPLCSAQAVHVVGGSSGWSIPSSSSFYSTWAATQTFKVGDILVFNFTTGSHSVATVTQSAYNACNTASPIKLITVGPVNITVTSGTNYYICTYTGHCTAGQKLSVTATTSTTSAASPPSTPSTTSPTSSPNSSAKTEVSGVFPSLVSIAVALAVAILY